MKRFWLAFVLVVVFVGCDPAGNIPFEDFAVEPASGDSVEVLGSCSLSGDVAIGASCVRLRVTCQGLEGTTANLRITPRLEGTAYLGTVVLGSGGNGREFVAGDMLQASSPAGTLVLELSKQGYTVVERRWEDGWFGSNTPGAGLVAPACRYANLLAWVDNQVVTEEGAFCAYGNSGGSSEIAYALTRYGAEELLDVAVLGGGPPMSRLDIGCFGVEANSAEADSCRAVWRDSQSSCGRRQPVCDLVTRASATGPLEIDQAFSTNTQASACTGQDGSFATLFVDEGVVAPVADLAYPNTHVHFIHGQEDCTEAVTLGWLYYDAILSAKTLENPAGVPHTVYETNEGARAINSALQTYCVAP